MKNIFYGKEGLKYANTSNQSMHFSNNGDVNNAEPNDINDYMTNTLAPNFLKWKQEKQNRS